MQWNWGAVFVVVSIIAVIGVVWYEVKDESWKDDDDDDDDNNDDNIDDWSPGGAVYGNKKEV